MNDYLLMIAGSDIDSFYQIEEFPEASEVTMAQPLGKKVGGCVLNVAAVSASKGINTKVLDYLKENDEDTELLINTLKEKIQQAAITSLPMHLQYFHSPVLISLLFLLILSLF